MMAKIPNIPALAFHWDIDEILNPYIPPPRLHRLPYWLAHFLGYRKSTDEDGFTTKSHHHSTVLFWSFFGEFVSLVIVEAIFMNIGGELKRRDVPYIFPAFSASAILLFNALDSPLGTPRPFILGHFFCSIIGVGIPKLFLLNPNGEEYLWLAGALACSIATAFMRFTNTIHPPAGATALLPSINKQVQGLDWWYIPATLLMSVVMLVTALIIDNIQRRYPEYWWTPLPLGKVPDEKDVEAGVEIRREMTRQTSRMSRRAELQEAQMRRGSGSSGEDEIWEEKTRGAERDQLESNDTLVGGDEAVNEKGDTIVIGVNRIDVPPWIEARLGLLETRVLEQLHGMILQRARENADLVRDTDENGDPPTLVRSRTHFKEN